MSSPVPQQDAAQATSPELVVLDMDGVLLTLPLRTEWVRAQIGVLFAQAGFAEPIRPLFLGIDRAAQAVRNARGEALAEEVRRAAWALIDQEELRAAARCAPRRAVGELLCAAARGRRVVLYTNNHLAAVRQALARAGIPEKTFETIYARQGASSLKPSGGPIVEAARGLADRPLPPRIWMVGDQPGDMISAIEAESALRKGGWEGEMIPLGIRGPFRTDEALEQGGAAMVAADLEEAADLLAWPRFGGTLSMVIVAYNEEAAIAQAIEDARRVGRGFTQGYEIIVVDDGSRDQTAARAEAANQGDVRLLHHPRNLGMGAAMRSGYEAARMDYLVHLPADRQVRPQALAQLLPRVAADLVVLTKYHLPPSGLRRKLASIAFRRLLHQVGRLEVDFAGTYLFHRGWLTQVDLNQFSNTFLLSFELLDQLKASGAHFARVLIHNFPRRGDQSREFSPSRIVHLVREVARVGRSPRGR